MRIKGWLSALVILSVVIVGLGLIKFGQIQAAIAFAASFPEPSASVKSTYPQPTSYAKITKVIGQLEAKQTLMISNEYAGAITKVGFKPGDMVEKNQVLLELDTSIEQANLLAAKARLTLANKTLKRLKKLVLQDRISQDEVDRAQADATIAQAEVNNLSSVISKKTIRAPFSGRIDLTQYHVGQLLDVNSEIAFLVGDDQEIWLNFSIPQTLPQLSIGDQVEVSIPTSSEQSRVVAKVIAKHALVDMNSRQQSYRAVISNQDNALIHNQIVNVFVAAQAQQIVMVPTNAIARNHFGNFVYNLVEDEQGNLRAKAIKVTLGDKIGDMQVVLSGLAGQELIASEGAFKLRESLLVYTQQPEASASVGG